ncbi:MAG TPA: hypothetical protein VML55_18360 [Planctomycetaceae bacterium]|nr:hypothetical protein [Planctomycetaceae bacterium]
MFHYTDKPGYNAIRATVEWCFRATQPPARHNPVGAYFTLLPPGTPLLAKRIRVPKSKTEFAFSFVDAGDLKPLRGRRGRYILYSKSDYTVDRSRLVVGSQTPEIEELISDLDRTFRQRQAA